MEHVEVKFKAEERADASITEGQETEVTPSTNLGGKS